VMTGGASQAAPHGPTMNIQVLSFNDFHGNLEPPSGSSGRVVTDHALSTTPEGVTSAVNVTTDAGGVEYLATHLREARKGNRNTVTVAAGDIVGASPLLSAAFHDEPTIEAMNKLGLEATAVGNHEFDEGYKELQRLQNGGCLDDGDGLNNQNSCAAGTFTGANFHILAANVKDADTNKTILPPYWVKTFEGGAKVGFIGMTLKETPSIVTQSGIAGLDFTDEVATANALVPALRAQGVKAIVVLVHQGGTPAAQQWKARGKTYNVTSTYDYTCGGGGTLASDSAILPIAANLDPQIDMVISGHTHQPYICNVPDPKGQQRLVTSASSFGRLFTETNLRFDMRTQDIVRASVKGTNMIVTRDVAKAADETSLINTYKTLIAPIANKVLGTITADITRVQSPAGESALGDLIADAQVNDPSVVVGEVKPVVAFMNPGGIRADLTFAKTDPPEATNGIVRYEEAFTVQPFNNYLVSMDVTGADIWSLLQQQWSGKNSGTATKFLQVSNGLHYTWTGVTPDQAVTAVTINGVPVAKDSTASYRIVTNNFLSDGGDNFAAFTNGTGKYFGGLDIDGFAKYLPTVQPYSPAALDRIAKQ
ncbi:MAG: bifunctional metallophosphatase/5'-nucleotidase, partial [Dermatophilaceae bacterium]